MKYIIDVNNVLRLTKGEYHVSYLNAVIKMLDGFSNPDVVCIADANVEHLIDEQCSADEKELFASIQKLLRRRFAVVPGGIKADEFILQFAEAYDAQVVSNDRYRDYAKKYSWVSDETRLHKLTVICGLLMIPTLGLRARIDGSGDEVVGQCGETIDKALLKASGDISGLSPQRVRVCPAIDPDKIETSSCDEIPWYKREDILVKDVNQLSISPWGVVAGVAIIALAAWIGWDGDCDRD